MVIIPFVTHQKQLLANISAALMLNHLFRNDYEERRPPFICVIFIIYSFSCIKYSELIDIEKIFNYLLPLNDEICKLLKKFQMLLIFHQFQLYKVKNLYEKFYKINGLLPKNAD